MFLRAMGLFVTVQIIKKTGKNSITMKAFWSRAGWAGVALLGTAALANVALARGESLNALWLITAAICVYLIGYRFYAAWIAANVLAIDATRATPAERLNNGRDYVPTNRWVVFGHHFAAIAGPGPLVGPTLAAQFGYLPGTLWILIGAVLGGAVQDMVTLFLSTRRNGRSLGQMARDEIGAIGGGRSADRHIYDYDYPDCGAGSGGGQRHET